MAKGKNVLTTGEVARICNVAPRTVSKWFDSGQLKGYRIPGSRDRRIPVAALSRFMKEHNMPLEGLGVHATRILLVDADEKRAGDVVERLAEAEGYDVQSVGDAFQLGVRLLTFSPHIVLIKHGCAGLDAAELCRSHTRK
jgi:excisionase family DNA binding protein